MSLSTSSLYHRLLLLRFVPSRRLLSTSDCSASVCEMDDNSWEQRCCDTDGTSRHLGGQRGLEQANPRVASEKERFCHACSFHPKPAQTLSAHSASTKKPSATPAKVLISVTFLWLKDIVTQQCFYLMLYQSLGPQNKTRIDFEDPTPLPQNLIKLL